jgi:hypothetical protein
MAKAQQSQAGLATQVQYAQTALPQVQANLEKKLAELEQMVANKSRADDDAERAKQNMAKMDEQLNRVENDIRRGAVPPQARADIISRRADAESRAAHARMMADSMRDQVARQAEQAYATFAQRSQLQSQLDALMAQRATNAQQLAVMLPLQGMMAQASARNAALSRELMNRNAVLASIQNPAQQQNVRQAMNALRSQIAAQQAQFQMQANAFLMRPPPQVPFVQMPGDALALAQMQRTQVEEASRRLRELEPAWRDSMPMVNRLRGERSAMLNSLQRQRMGNIEAARELERQRAEMLGRAREAQAMDMQAMDMQRMQARLQRIENELQQRRAMGQNLRNSVMRVGGTALPQRVAPPVVAAGVSPVRRGRRGPGRVRAMARRQKEKATEVGKVQRQMRALETKRMAQERREKQRTRQKQLGALKEQALREKMQQRDKERRTREKAALDKERALREKAQEREKERALREKAQEREKERAMREKAQEREKERAMREKARGRERALREKERAVREAAEKVALEKARKTGKREVQKERAQGEQKQKPTAPMNRERAAVKVKVVYPREATRDRERESRGGSRGEVNGQKDTPPISSSPAWLNALEKRMQSSTVASAEKEPRALQQKQRPQGISPKALELRDRKMQKKMQKQLQRELASQRRKQQEAQDAMRRRFLSAGSGNQPTPQGPGIPSPGSTSSTLGAGGQGGTSPAIPEKSENPPVGSGNGQIRPRKKRGVQQILRPTILQPTILQPILQQIPQQIPQPIPRQKIQPKRLRIKPKSKKKSRKQQQAASGASSVAAQGGPVAGGVPAASGGGSGAGSGVGSGAVDEANSPLMGGNPEETAQPMPSTGSQVGGPVGAGASSVAAQGQMGMGGFTQVPTKSQGSIAPPGAVVANNEATSSFAPVAPGAGAASKGLSGQPQMASPTPASSSISGSVIAPVTQGRINM